VWERQKYEANKGRQRCASHYKITKGKKVAGFEDFANKPRFYFLFIIGKNIPSPLL